MFAESWTRGVRTYFGYLAVGTNDVVVSTLDDFVVDFLDGKAEVTASVVDIDGSERGLVYLRRKGVTTPRAMNTDLSVCTRRSDRSTGGDDWSPDRIPGLAEVRIRTGERRVSTRPAQQHRTPSHPAQIERKSETRCNERSFCFLLLTLCLAPKLKPCLLRRNSER